MHDTLNPLVKAYIEEVRAENNKLMFRGWAFHSFYPIVPLRLKGATHEVLADYHPRDDVQQVYGISDKPLCGWTCEYPCREDVVLEFLSSENWEKLLDAYCDGNKSSYSAFTTVVHGRNNITPRITSNLYKSFVVVDNFYENPDEVRKFALGCKFSYHPDYHKGKRTDELYRFPGLKESFESILGRKIKNWENHGTNGCFQICVAGEQLVYHFDGQTYAGVLFLTPDAPPNCGTTFYRSKITKKMRVSDQEHPVVFQNGFLDSTMFDVVDVVGNVYNRVVLFDAKLIHAASCYFGTDENNGRLFQLFFFDFE